MSTAGREVEQDVKERDRLRQESTRLKAKYKDVRRTISKARNVLVKLQESQHRISFPSSSGLSSGLVTLNYLPTANYCMLVQIIRA